MLIDSEFVEFLKLKRSNQVSQILNQKYSREENLKVLNGSYTSKGLNSRVTNAKGYDPFLTIKGQKSK